MSLFKPIGKKTNQSGFSLIELMIVVSILGVLTTIAIPNFKRFQARAKQKEGLAMLSSYYKAAKATHAEFTYYYCNFPAIGFKPEGEMSYRIVATDDGINENSNQFDSPTCVSTEQGICAPLYQTWTEKESARTPIFPSTCFRNFFRTMASAHLNGLAIDTWSINSNKLLLNEIPGID